MFGGIDAIEYSLAIILPLIFGRLLTRRFQVRWKVFWIGAAVKILASLGYLALLIGLSFVLKTDALPFSPVMILLFVVGITSLLSAILMQLMRRVGLKWIKEPIPGFGSALTLGAGSGGVALMFGGLSMFLYWGFLLLMDQIGTLHIPIVNYDLRLTGVTPSPHVFETIFDRLLLHLVMVLKQLVPFMMELALTILVWMAMIRKKIEWFLGAILWHTIWIAVCAILMDMMGLSFWTLQKVHLSLGAQAVILAFLFCIPLGFVILRWRGNRQDGQAIETEMVTPESSA